jgi:hypothetical protein
MAQWARALASGPLRSCPGIGVSAGSRAVDDGEMADAGAPWPRRCACRSPLTPAGSSGRPPRRRIHVTTTWRWTSGWVPAPTSWILAAGVGSGRSRRAGLTVRNELGSSWRSWPVQQQTRRTQQQDPADQPPRLRPPQPRRRHRHDLPLLQRTDHHAAHRKARRTLKRKQSTGRALTRASISRAHPHDGLGVRGRGDPHGVHRPAVNNLADRGCRSSWTGCVPSSRCWPARAGPWRGTAHRRC